MIDIAARATNGVRIDNLRNTRQAIIDLFKKNLTSLRLRFKVRGLEMPVHSTEA